MEWRRCKVFKWNEVDDWFIYGIEMLGPYLDRRLCLVLIWNEDDLSFYGKKMLIGPFME
jgi:hypothetical protein